MKKAVNIKEELNIKEEYYALSKDIRLRILVNTGSSNQKIVIGIGGESGCGKSTTAFCLEQEFIQQGFNCTTLHMDSYFKLPPKDNHQNRVKSLNNVGSHEVNMNLLNEHIRAFKSGIKEITIPIVDYLENRFTNRDLDLSQVNILIVEGVYSFLLDNLDHKIFLSRSYHDTFENRIKRTREKHNPLIESILEIEHQIVSPLIREADFVIDKNYQIQ